MNSLEDFILTYISEQTIIHPKDIKDKFQKKGYNMERITQAITDIDSEGLISTAQGKTESICGETISILPALFGERWVLY